MVVGKVPLNAKVSMVPVPIDVSRCVGVMDKLGDADWLGGGVARVAMWCSRDGAAMGAAWLKIKKKKKMRVRGTIGRRVLGLYMVLSEIFGIVSTLMIMNGVPSLLKGVNSMDGYEGYWEGVVD